MLRRRLLLTALLPVCLMAAPAHAADKFTYTMRRDLRPLDVRSGAALPFASEREGAASRRTLGVTGRVAIWRGPTMVEDGGQVFVHATVPEALAGKPHDLDVLVGGQVRGSIPYDPKGGRRVARLFVLPDLQPGPAMVEVHVRGVHVDDWQEIVTEAVDVPKNGRLAFGYALEGSSGSSPPIELVVEARPAEGDAGKGAVVFRRKVAAGSKDWKDVSEDLGAVEGRRVHFVFRSRPAGDATGGADGVVWGAPAVENDEKRRAYPIVVLVSLDSLRTSSVGLYAGGASTPFLDSFFGRKGAIMMQASSQSVTTLPSHLTMLTGLNPMSHGVVDERSSLGPGVLTLAEALHSRGWNTAAFTEGGALAGEFGFSRGFDLYDEGRSSAIDPSTADAIERARAWVDEYSGAPLFLFVHTYATRPVHTGVDAKRDPRIRDVQLGGYVDRVRAADAALKGLFDTLKGRVDEKNSLYVVTTGHGEEFFEHGAAGHGTQLYDETVRVPLLLRAERIENPGPHSFAVGLVDVAPTILELVRLRAPSGMQGRSFAPLVESGRAVLAAPRFSEARRPVRLTSEGRLLLWGPPSFAVRDGTRKVVWNSGGDGSYEAYELGTDPREQRNLARGAQMPDWAQRLATSLRSYPATAGRLARPGGRAELSPANRSRLESLGYAR